MKIVKRSISICIFVAALLFASGCSKVPDVVLSPVPKDPSSLGGSVAPGATSSDSSASSYAFKCNDSAKLPPCNNTVPESRIKHVFLIVLENKGIDVVEQSPEMKKLAGEGVWLKNYWGIGHNSLDNYIAMISGQAPNPRTQMDCSSYEEWKAPGERERESLKLKDRIDKLIRRSRSRDNDEAEDENDEDDKEADPAEINTGDKTVALLDRDHGDGATGVKKYGLRAGFGCIYPEKVLTIADQLDEEGKGWKAYMEGMKGEHGKNDNCVHPDPGQFDKTVLPPFQKGTIITHRATIRSSISDL